MKQSFLDSLIGLPFNVAEIKVKLRGFDIVSISAGAPIAAIARPKTVVLGLSAGKVKTADPGDFCELEKESDEVETAVPSNVEQQSKVNTEEGVDTKLST